ncbi:MAG: hypothetical protein AAY43_04960 [Methanosarcina sp. 795]|nr:MAG: hypothetical protein AAY43_04960 [Methanosarcina sp. 795]
MQSFYIICKRDLHKFICNDLYEFVVKICAKTLFSILVFIELVPKLLLYLFLINSAVISTKDSIPLLNQ